MAIRFSNEAELRQAYLDTIQNLVLSGELLKARKPHRLLQSLDRDLIVRTPELGAREIQGWMLERVRKLQIAIEQPEVLLRTVLAPDSRQPLQVNGLLWAIALGRTHALERVPYRKLVWVPAARKERRLAIYRKPLPQVQIVQSTGGTISIDTSPVCRQGRELWATTEQSETVTAVRTQHLDWADALEKTRDLTGNSDQQPMERKLIVYRKPLPQPQDASPTGDTVRAGTLLTATRIVADKALWVSTSLLAAGAFGIGAIFAPNDIREAGMQLEKARLEARLREKEARQFASKLYRRELEVRRIEATRTSTVNVDIAIALIEDFYHSLSVKQFERATMLLGPQLRAASSLKFFNRFTRVTVENLRLVSERDGSINLVGENTYVYPDGSTQREARSYTVRNLDGRLQIVTSEFIKVKKSR